MSVQYLMKFVYCLKIILLRFHNSISYLPVDVKNNKIKSKKYKIKSFVGRCCTL